MTELLILITVFNLVAIPIYCFRRITKKGFIAFINPCLYLLILSYFYLGVSSALLEYYLSVNYDYLIIFQSFSKQVIQETNLLCHWFVFVFFVFYLISSDPKLVTTEFKPRKKSYQLALFFLGLCTVATLASLLINGSSLINASRKEALVLFGEISSRYRFANILTITLGALAVVVWRTKNFKWYLILLIPLILSILSRGRSLIVSTVVFTYINYVSISGRILIFPLSILALGILYSGSIDSFTDPLPDFSVTRLLGEFLNTRLTTLLTYKFFLNEGDLGLYLASSLLNLLPGAVSDAIIGGDILSFAEGIREYYQYHLGYGLAGNLVSEALFYGGIPFAILDPIIIGGFFYVFNQIRVYKYYPGFIFLCYMCANLFEIMRGNFYSSVPGLIYIMFSYLLWLTLLEWGRVVFISSEKKVNIYNTNTISKNNDRLKMEEHENG